MVRPGRKARYALFAGKKGRGPGRRQIDTFETKKTANEQLKRAKKAGFTNPRLKKL